MMSSLSDSSTGRRTSAGSPVPCEGDASALSPSVGAATGSGGVSDASGKKRAMPSGRSDDLMDLPYDLGVLTALPLARSYTYPVHVSS